MNKPNKIETNLDNFPAALAPLCEIDHWVLWRWVLRKGKWTKPPFMATVPKCNAKNNDPATWASYQATAAAAGTADGVGFMLLDTPFAAIDLDHCVDGDEIDPWAKALVDAANGAYVERTPSGEGLRIIGIGVGEKLHRKFKIEGAREGAAIEVYRDCERYITITGAQLGECKEIPELDLLDKIVAEYGNKNGFDFNKASASVNYDEIIQSGAPAGADVSAVFHQVIGHLSAKGLTVDKIVEELSKWPNGIARRYAGRLRGEIERSFEKWQAKRKINANNSNAAVPNPTNHRRGRHATRTASRSPPAPTPGAPFWHSMSCAVMTYSTTSASLKGRSSLIFLISTWWSMTCDGRFTSLSISIPARTTCLMPSNSCASKISSTRSRIIWTA